MSYESHHQDVAQALEHGDVPGALAIYEKLTCGCDADSPLLAEYAFLLWRVYEYKRGSELFANLLRDRNTDELTIRGIAKCFFQVGRFGLAAEAMRVAVTKTDPADAESLELYAGALERDNQIDTAREQAELALQINPSSGRAVRLLAHLEKRQGEYDRAVARLQSHLRTYPSDFDWGLRYELAASLDRQGEYDAAWNQLGLAKAQLRPRTEPHLKESYIIRQRQWDFAKRVTATDLKNWRKDGKEIDSPLKLALLAGFPRSGTTLLEQIIASNAACVGTDETGILASQFTMPLIWQASTTDDALIELRSFHADAISAGHQTYIKCTEEFIDEPIDGRLLIEKDPLMTPDLAMALRLFPEAPVLMPLRDPRDVVISYYFTMVPLNWNSSPATSIVEACHFYFDCIRHWLLWRDRLLCRWHETRYEAMIDDPAHEIRQVVDFLGLKWDESMLDEKQRSERKAVRTPTYDDIVKPIYSRAVGRWRNYAKHLERVMSTLEPFNKAFGYE